MRRYALNGILEFYFRNLLNRAFKFGLIVSLTESLYSQVVIEIHQTCYNNQMLYNESLLFPCRMRLEQQERRRTEHKNKKIIMIIMTKFLRTVLTCSLEVLILFLQTTN